MRVGVNSPKETGRVTALEWDQECPSELWVGWRLVIASNEPITLSVA